MNEFFTITFIIIFAAISPGPDFALIVKNTLEHNRKIGVYTAFGISSSLLIHSIYAILGLALIITHSLLLFKMIKYIGAMYLMYLGLRSLLSTQSKTGFRQHSTVKSITRQQAFYQGLLCNLLNPKAILFILAFFTLIIKPSTSWIAQVWFGIEIALIHFIWFSFLAIMMTHRYIQIHLNKIQFYIVKAMGILLICFGAYIAISQ